MRNRRPGCQELIQEKLPQTGDGNIFTIGATIGNHTGPGTVAISGGEKNLAHVVRVGKKGFVLVNFFEYVVPTQVVFGKISTLVQSLSRSRRYRWHFWRQSRGKEIVL